MQRSLVHLTPDPLVDRSLALVAGSDEYLNDDDVVLDRWLASIEISEFEHLLDRLVADAGRVLVRRLSG